VYWIELPNANEQLQSTDDATSVVINQVARNRQENQLTKSADKSYGAVRFVMEWRLAHRRTPASSETRPTHPANIPSLRSPVRRHMNADGVEFACVIAPFS